MEIPKISVAATGSPQNLYPSNGGISRIKNEENSSNLYKKILICCAITLIGHAIIYTKIHIDHVEFLLNAANLERDIQDDQINELIANLQQSVQTNESLKTQGFIAGALETINKRDATMAIWHSGYDRGYEAQQQAISLNLEKTKKDQTEAGK